MGVAPIDLLEDDTLNPDLVLHLIPEVHVALGPPNAPILQNVLGPQLDLLNDHLLDLLQEGLVIEKEAEVYLLIAVIQMNLQKKDKKLK